VVPRFVIAVLLSAFCVLIVSFGVLMGGYAIAEAAGDHGGATVLRWTAAGCLILLVIDCTLLLGALGIIHVQRQPAPPPRDDRDPTDV
jgi:hypothetical protein